MGEVVVWRVGERQLGRCQGRENLRMRIVHSLAQWRMHIKHVHIAGFKSYKLAESTDAFSPACNVIGACMVGGAPAGRLEDGERDERASIVCSGAQWDGQDQVLRGCVPRGARRARQPSTRPAQEQALRIACAAIEFVIGDRYATLRGEERRHILHVRRGGGKRGRCAEQVMHVHARRRLCRRAPGRL